MKKGRVYFIVIVLMLTLQIAHAQWIQKYELKGKRISRIIADNSGDLFISTASGIFLSTDNGTSWTEISSGLPLPSESNMYLLAVNKKENIAAASRKGIFYSDNRGTTWNFIDSFSTDSYIQDLAMNDDGYIFVGMHNDSIYRYNNNGLNWIKVSSGLHKEAYNPASDRDHKISCIALHSTGDIWAGTWERGLYKSTDNGTTWSFIHCGDNEIRAIAISSRGAIFVGTHEDGVMISTDNGETWTVPDSGSEFDEDWGCYNFAMYQNYIFGENITGMYMSNNNGKTWTTISEGLPRGGLHNRYWINSITVGGGYIFAAFDSSVWARPVSDLVNISGDVSPLRASKNALFTIQSSNHRHPFMTVEYSLPGQEHVYLDIYTLSGCKFRSFVDKYRGPGLQRCMINTEQFPAGRYTLRMRAGSNVYAKNISISH